MDIAFSTTPPKPKRNTLKKFKIWFIILLILSVAFWFLFLRPYSEGYIDGKFTKLSKKGFIFKTWEGYINRTTFGTPDYWYFSTNNAKVIKTLNDYKGVNPIKLHYKEYIFQLFFLGDTNYFVDEADTTTIR